MDDFMATPDFRNTPHVRGSNQTEYGPKNEHKWTETQDFNLQGLNINPHKGQQAWLCSQTWFQQLFQLVFQLKTDDSFNSIQQMGDVQLRLAKTSPPSNAQNRDDKGNHLKVYRLFLVWEICRGLRRVVVSNCKSEDSFKLTFTAGHFVSKNKGVSLKGYEPNSPVFFALSFFVLTWTMEPGPSLCLLGTVAWA